jgi:hypothetical protein
MGRPAFTPDDEQRRIVKELAGVGLPQPMIARIIGVAKETLYKYFEEELHLGAAEATGAIAKTLYAKAIGGDTASLIFWLKCRANWAERADRNTGVLDVDPEVETIPTVELERRIAAARRARTVAPKEGSGEPDSLH